MRVVLLAVVTLLLAAPAAAAPRTDLKIRYWPEGRENGTPQTWTLRCAPGGGSLPGASSACRKLGRLRDPFAPVPKDTVCTELYGGPAEVLVTGSYGDRRIWVRLTRRNGCEIGRFERLRFLAPTFRGDGA